MRRHSREQSQSSIAASSLPLHNMSSTHNDAEWEMEGDDQHQPFLEETKDLNNRISRERFSNSKSFMSRVLSLVGMQSTSSQSKNQQSSHWQGLAVGAVCAMVVLLGQSLVGSLSSWSGVKVSCDDTLSCVYRC